MFYSHASLSSLRCLTQYTHLSHFGFIFLLIAAPTEAASSLRIETLSSKSLRVHWVFSSSDPLNKNYDGFYVGYREMSSSSDDKMLQSSSTSSSSASTSMNIFSRKSLSSASQSQTALYSFKTIELPSSSKASLLNRNDFHATLNDLKRNTRYAVIVQAFNRKGPGPNSDEVTAQTAEFGKQIPKLSFTLFFMRVMIMLWEWCSWIPVEHVSGNTSCSANTASFLRSSRQLLVLEPRASIPCFEFCPTDVTHAVIVRFARSFFVVYFGSLSSF